MYSAYNVGKHNNVAFNGAPLLMSRNGIQNFWTINFKNAVITSCVGSGSG